MDNRMRKKRISAAYRYCFARLVLQMWLYYEERMDQSDRGVDDSDEMTNAGEEFAEILKKFLAEKEGAPEALEQLKALREKMTAKMEVLTAFSDCFVLHEYILNRVERRFHARKDSGYTPAQLAASLTDAMDVMEDPIERNDFLRKIMVQLPMRLTRRKFYSMVAERLSAYTGLNRKNVENSLSLLRSFTMIRLPEGMEKEERLYELLEELGRVDYRNLDREGFHRCEEVLIEAGKVMDVRMDYVLSMEKMINDLYVLFLTQNEKLGDALEDMNFRNSIKEILDALEKRDKTLLEECEIPVKMEGIQESVMDLVMAGSPEKDEILSKVDRLVSGSFFMTVEEEETSDETADRQWIDKETKKFCEELDKVFEGRQKAVVRAVMAKLIARLPIVFQDSAQVEDYIRSSLESCTDYAEREASMELLEQELEEHVLV